MVRFGFEDAVDIEADPSVVWAFLTEAGNMARWRNGVTFAEPGKLTLGSKAHYRLNFGMSGVEELVRLVPNEMLITRVAVEDMTPAANRKSPGFNWQMAWKITALNGNSRVTCQSHGEIGGITGLICWLIRGLLARRLKDAIRAP